jgi:HEAT repeat protein
MYKCLAMAVSIMLTDAVLMATPISGQEAQRRKDAIARFDAELAKAGDDDGKLAVVRQATRDESIPDMRREFMSRALALKAPGLEDWLIERLREEPDCMVRGEVALLLGKTGSPKAVDPLIAAAKSDAETTGEIGCIRMHGTVRRQAMFALAEMGGRLADERGKIIKALRALPDRDDKQDHESLHDVRRQALYQLTGEKNLLDVFFRRLADKEPKERIRGVVAFQFLKLRQAPAEIVALLRDTDEQVRSWAAVVLDRIGDPATAPALMAAAENANAGRNTRANAIVALKNMKAQNSMELMKRLAKDGDEVIAFHAAAAIEALQAAPKPPASSDKPAE